jgi:cation:H+ antiporter
MPAGGRVATLATIAVLAAASTAVVWVGTRLLDRSAEHLSDAYGLPPVVQGAVVLAVGSSMPELSATLLSTLLHGEFGLGVGTVVGSAVFNILVIPGLVGLAAGGADANRDLVFKESLFYMLSIAVLVLTFALAVIYEPAGEGRLAGEVTRTLALAPLALYGLYVAVQWLDVSGESTDGEPEASTAKAWGQLVVGIALIVVAVEGLVRAAIDLGDLLGTPSYVWGLTVVAAASSLPDASVSLRAALDERAVPSLANALGSNVFDLCVAVPVGVLLAGSVVVDFAAAVPMLGALTAATVLLFAFLRTDLRIATWEAAGLLAAYLGFLVFALESGGLVSRLFG